MGELAADWRAFDEYKKKRRQNIEPSRVEYAANALVRAGCTVAYNACSKALFFECDGIAGKIFPFTGWFSAKGIGDGRGIERLIKKLKEARSYDDCKRLDKDN